MKTDNKGLKLPESLEDLAKLCMKPTKRKKIRRWKAR